MDGDDAEVSDINITPLVDVMLVLLIIFIITVPVLTHSVKLNLPRAQTEVNRVPPQTVTISVDVQGKAFWNETPVSKAEYESVLYMMAAAQRVGALKLGFVTDPGSDQ